jgi:hypothetical protein
MAKMLILNPQLLKAYEELAYNDGQVTYLQCALSDSTALEKRYQVVWSTVQEGLVDMRQRRSTSWSAFLREARQHVLLPASIMADRFDYSQALFGPSAERT